MSSKLKNKKNTFNKNWDALKLLTTIKLVKNPTFQRNLDTFKLLETYDEFQVAIKPIREQLSVAQHQLKIDEINIYEYANLLNILNEEILEKFNLPFHFRQALSTYLQTGKFNENDIPNRNYDFRFDKRLTINNKGVPVTPAHQVKIITYSKLTDNEIQEMVEALKKIQTLTFPKTKLFNRFNTYENINKDLKVEERGNKRRRPKTKEVYNDHYLSVVKKGVALGKISQKEFDRIKKLNLSNIKRIKDGYTSNEIAEELNSSPSSIRQIIRRLRNERAERFVYKRDNN